jgi:hypothetical protein
MIAAKPKGTEVTTGAAARFLKLSQDTVNRLCEEGALRARRVPPNGWWRIDCNSLVEYSSKLHNC